MSRGETTAAHAVLSALVEGADGGARYTLDELLDGDYFSLSAAESKPEYEPGSFSITPEPAREGVIRTALRRLIAGRRLLGYELAYERGLLDEDVLTRKILEFQAGRPDHTGDLRQQIAILYGLIGDDISADIITLVTGASWEEAEAELDRFPAPNRGMQ